MSFYQKENNAKELDFLKNKFNTSSKIQEKKLSKFLYKKIKILKNLIFKNRFLLN